MRKEIGYITDILNKQGLREGDLLHLRPFGKKSRTLRLTYKNYEFGTKLCKSYNWSKSLDSIQGEHFHYELLAVEVNSANNTKSLRYMFKSKCGTPFKLNGSFVTEAFLEIGDTCEIGFHKIECKRKEDPRAELELYSRKFLENDKMITSNLSILIEGETGVGKTTLAREIHNQSNVSGKFVHINLSAYSKSLLESELFGHVKGAFTGALTDKKGALRQAQGGTLFIDEIDSLPLEIQTKLLIFLDSKEVTPVGSEISYVVNARIICASGQKLIQLVDKGCIRKDFYFRIASGANINIPSLRDNTDLIRKYCQIYTVDKNISISEKLIEFYQTLPWPGNLRQLRGHLDKKFIMLNGRKMDFDDIDNHMVTLSSELYEVEIQDSLTMQELKLNYARKIYFECNKNLARASKLLGISTKSLKGFIELEKSA